VTFFDAADMYAAGASEEVTGACCAGSSHVKRLNSGQTGRFIGTW
jgi:aryl-alcohol dehydrogenase-like predicted oxidoreductase